MKNTARFDIRDFFCAIKRPMIKRIVRIWRLKRPSVYNFITKFLSYNNSYFSISNLSNIKIDSITESRERERESRLRKRKQKERKKERNLSISRSLKRYTEKTRGMLTNSKLCRVSLGLWESLGRGGGSQFSLVNAARLANFEPRLRGGQAKQKNLPGKLVRNKRERNIAIVLINICKYSRYFFGIELW